RHMARAARDRLELGPRAFAAIGAGRIRGPDDNHRSAPVAARGKLGSIAPHRTRLDGVDRRGLGPAALDIAERVGPDARGFAAFWREARLHQVGEPVAERA